MTDPRTKRPGESDSDVAQRLLLHPMWEGATDSEIAFDGQVPHAVVREQRAVMLATVEATQTAKALRWDGTATDLIVTALRNYAKAKNAELPTDQPPPSDTPFLDVLRSQGVTLEIVGDDKFRSEPRQLREDIRDYIVANRAAIVAELKR